MHDSWQFNLLLWQQRANENARMRLAHILGLPWIQFLDDVSATCHEATHGRVPCTLMVACLWFYILSEVRVLAAKGVEYLKILYKPKKALIGEYWSLWGSRLGICLVTVLFSYFLTFNLPPLFELHWIEDDDGNARLSRSEQTGGERMLVSELMAKSILYQTESIIWIMGTLLNMPRKRFLPLYIASKVFAPVAGGTADRSGNFALWLAVGLAFSKLFRLNPVDEPRIGTVGTTLALLTSSMHGMKVGTVEIVLSIATVILSELAWRHFMKRLREKKEQLKQKMRLSSSKKDDDYEIKKPGSQISNTASGKKNAFQRLWSFIMSDVEKKGSFEAWPPLKYPTLPTWLGLALGWFFLGAVLTA
jgi:hypothetical protein